MSPNRSIARVQGASFPVTWERDGKQYITITNGATGPYAMR